jgi:hypothetical protein
MSDTYCLVYDDEGHWYVIPSRREGEFNIAIRDPYTPLPDWVVSVGGSPSMILFTGYDIPSNRKPSSEAVE